MFKSRKSNVNNSNRFFWSLSTVDLRKFTSSWCIDRINVRWNNNRCLNFNTNRANMFYLNKKISFYLHWSLKREKKNERKKRFSLQQWFDSQTRKNHWRKERHAQIRCMMSKEWMKYWSLLHQLTFMQMMMMMMMFFLFSFRSRSERWIRRGLFSSIFLITFRSSDTTN